MLTAVAMEVAVIIITATTLPIIGLYPVVKTFACRSTDGRSFNHGKDLPISFRRIIMLTEQSSY